MRVLRAMRGRAPIAATAERPHSPRMFRPPKTVIALALAAAAIAALPAQQPAPLRVAERVTHLDSLAREPMVAQLPGGALLVSGYSQSITSIWRSTNGGAAWQRLGARAEVDGLLANSDVALAVAPDGTLYWAAMVFDRSTGRGVAVNVGVSGDAGATWRWTQPTRAPFDDRPWIGVAPDGAVHLIWNDGGGVRHSMSTDRGATWTEGPRVSGAGGSSALAIGPHGELAVRIVPISASGNVFAAGADSLAISTDRGASWRTLAMPGTRDWRAFDDTSAAARRAPATPRWVEPVAFDAAGTLWAAWTDRGALHLARSTDLGAHWRDDAIAQGGATLYYPFLAARGDGDVAVSWFSGARDSLRVHVARVAAGRGSDAPRVAESEAIAIDAFGLTARHEDPATRSSAGEYVGVAFLRDGSLALVTPVQNERGAKFGFTFWRFAAP